MFPLTVSVLTMFILLDFLPHIQEHIHWLPFLGIHVSVAEFDVNDGFSLSLP